MVAQLRIIGVYVFLFPSAKHALRRFTIFWENSFEESLLLILFESSIGAFELMVFQNRIDQLDFFDQKHTGLDMLKDFMILTSITVIEHNDFFR